MADLQTIRENEDKLTACPLHRFPWDGSQVSNDDGPPRLELWAKFRCSECGGTMRGPEMLRYIQGYAAAGANPDDIMPGFRADPA